MPDRLAWLTPDNGGGVYLCRRFRFRAELAPFVFSQLLALTNEGAWEENGDLTVAQVQTMIQEFITSYLESEDTCMVASVIMYAGSSVPDGYLACDGSTYQRVAYPDLYAALGAIYIVDADNFRVPDLRSRLPIGIGDGSNGLTVRALGAQAGTETHQLTVPEMPSHTHTYETVAVPTADLAGELPFIEPTITPAVTGATGGDQAHNNMPPFHALGFAIRFRT